jgi:hypothetical protein
LNKALNQLDNEVDRQVEASRSSTEAAAELDRMIEDRTRIALELDRPRTGPTVWRKPTAKFRAVW